MRKKNLHTNVLLVLLLGFISLGACKSKKSTSHSSNLEAESLSKDVSLQAEIHFGNLYINGCTERMKGNYPEAKKLFEECLQLNPKNAALYYELAMIYKLQGAPNQALQNAKLCAAADQKNEWYQLLLAECFVANKQYQQSIKVRENLIKNFPHKKEFKEELAFEYSLIGEFNKALKIYNDLENQMGVNEQITLNKLRVLKNSGNLPSAEKELLKLLETNKSEIRFYNYLAEFYNETREIEKAKTIYDKIIQLDPTNPNVYLALHDYHVSKGKHQEAYNDLVKAIENPIVDVASKSQIIEDYYRGAERGQPKYFEEGLFLAKIAAKLHPDESAINAVCGDFYRLDKNLKEAMVYYYKAAFADKNNYRVWQNLLITENDLFMHDSLVKHSQLAIDMFPNQPIFYLYNGVANTTLKKHDKAATALKDGLALCMGNKRLMIDFLSAAGDNYYQGKDFSNSDKSFEEALKLDADNTYVLNNYAYYLSLRSVNIELAEKLARRANELKPNNANYMDTYGWIFFQQKKYEQALEWISGAAKLSQSLTIIEHYGDVLFHLNKLEEALRQWTKARDKGNKSEKLEKKIKDKKWYE